MSENPLSTHCPPELAQARLAILGELESSLEAAQKALLAHDLGGIEQETPEQMRLQRAFAILTAPVAAPAGDPAREGARTPDEAQLLSALHSAELRVLHLALVQTALLSRAQRTARMMTNLLAGPYAAYAASPGSDAGGVVVGRSERSTDV